MVTEFETVGVSGLHRGTVVHTFTQEGEPTGQSFLLLKDSNPLRRIRPDKPLQTTAVPIAFTDRGAKIDYQTSYTTIPEGTRIMTAGRMGEEGMRSVRMGLRDYFLEKQGKLQTNPYHLRRFAREAQEKEAARMRELPPGDRERFWEPYERLAEVIVFRGLKPERLDGMGGPLREGATFYDVNNAVKNGQIMSMERSAEAKFDAISRELQRVVSFPAKDK